MIVVLSRPCTPSGRVKVARGAARLSARTEDLNDHLDARKQRAAVGLVELARSRIVELDTAAVVEQAAPRTARVVCPSGFADEDKHRARAARRGRRA